MIKVTGRLPGLTKKLIRGPKIIAFELKKSSANIRKILSTLCKEGKITRVGFGEYVLSMNVLNESVNVEAPGKQGDSMKAYYKKVTQTLLTGVIIVLISGVIYLIYRW